MRQLLFFSQPPENHNSLRMATSICTETGGLFSPSLTLQCHSLTGHPQGRNILLWEAARVGCMEKQSPGFRALCRGYLDRHSIPCFCGDIPPTRQGAREGVHLSSGSFLTGKLVLTGSVSGREHLPTSKVLMSLLFPRQRSSALPRTGQTLVLLKEGHRPFWGCGHQGDSFPLSCSFSFEKNLGKQGPESNSSALASSSHSPGRHCHGSKGSRTLE